VIAFSTSSFVSDLFAFKYKAFPSAWKEIDQRFAEPSAFPGECLQAGLIAMRGDAAHVVSLRKANENM
jgi:hypothetical protein